MWVISISPKQRWVTAKRVANARLPQESDALKPITPTETDERKLGDTIPEKLDLDDPHSFAPGVDGEDAVLFFQAVNKSDLVPVTEHLPDARRIESEDSSEIYQWLDYIGGLNKWRTRCRAEIKYYAWTNSGEKPVADPADDPAADDPAVDPAVDAVDDASVNNMITAPSVATATTSAPGDTTTVYGDGGPTSGEGDFDDLPGGFPYGEADSDAYTDGLLTDEEEDF